MANGNDSITQSLLSNEVPVSQQPSIEPLEKIFYEPGNSAGLDVAQKKISDIQSKQSSFMPSFIATVAALTGNFGPAMQIQEQKRKTSDIQKMLPAMNEISRMKALGQYSDAAQALEMLSTKMGPRVPELGEMFKQQQQDLSNKQTQLNAAREGYKILKPHITKNNPDKPMWDSLGAALQAGTPGAAETYKTLVESRPNMQNQDQQSIITSGLSGAITTQPIPEVYEKKGLNNYVGLNVGQAHGLTPEELTNVMNNIPMSGVTDEKRSQIRKDLIGLQDVTADLGIANLINIPPELQAQMFANGVHPLQMATRRIGRSGMSEAIKGYFEKITESEKAKIAGTAAVDPRMPIQAGFAFMDTKPGLDYGRVHMGLSKEEGLAQGLTPFPMEDRKFAQDLFRARDNLNLVNKMFAATGVEGEKLWGVAARGGMLINRLTGLPTTGADGVSLRAMIDEAINIATTMKAVPSEEIANLRRLMTTEFATKKDVIDAANNLINNIDRQLGRIVGSSNIPQTTQEPALPRAKDQRFLSPEYQQQLKGGSYRIPPSGESPTGLKPGIIEGTERGKKR